MEQHPINFDTKRSIFVGLLLGQCEACASTPIAHDHFKSLRQKFVVYLHTDRMGYRAIKAAGQHYLHTHVFITGTQVAPTKKYRLKPDAHEIFYEIKTAV